jgi:hypothetical protein
VRRVPLGLAFLVLLLGAACGDDRLSAEEFAEKANAACVAGDRELETAGQELAKAGQPDTQQIADFFLQKAVPIARRKLDQIEALNPPSDQEDEVNDMLAAGREAIDEVADGLEEDPEAYLTAQGPDPFTDFDEAARELGLSRCASQPQALPGDGEATTTTTAVPTETTTAPPGTAPSS